MLNILGLRIGNVTLRKVVPKEAPEVALASSKLGSMFRKAAPKNRNAIVEPANPCTMIIPYIVKMLNGPVPSRPKRSRIRTFNKPSDSPNRSIQPSDIEIVGIIKGTSAST
jgi:hypothetical protein